MPLKHHYSEKALHDALNKLRLLMFDPEEARHVPRILAEVGVRYVIVETLPTAKIDGACLVQTGKARQPLSRDGGAGGTSGRSV